MGNCRGSKSPTVRLQTSRPPATRTRISEAIFRISEPMRPAAMVETRVPGWAPGLRASSCRSAEVCSVAMMARNYLTFGVRTGGLKTGGDALEHPELEPSGLGHQAGVPGGLPDQLDLGSGDAR